MLEDGHTEKKESRIQFIVCLIRNISCPKTNEAELAAAADDDDFETKKIMPTPNQSEQIN